MNGTDEIVRLRDAGFSNEEVAAWSAEQRAKLERAGFTDAEINAWGGRPEPDDTPLREYFTLNLDQWAQQKPRHITSLAEAFKAGWEGSSTGLLIHGKPETVIGPDEPRPVRLAEMVGGVVGDIPAMAVGALAGGGPASPATSMAGAMALPQGLRALFIDMLERGEITSVQEFLPRAQRALTETMKGWITGWATGKAGELARAAAPSILSPAAREAMVVAAEIPTMVTVGKGLEGQIPSVDDFIDASILLGGMKFTMKGVQVATGKVGKVYAKTGITPQQVVADVQSTPSIRADMLSTNIEVPRAYGGGVPPEPAITPPPPTEAKPVTTAAQTILSKISQEEPTTQWPTLSDVRTSVIDNLNPIKKWIAEGPAGVPPTEENAYQLKRLTRGLHGQMDEVIRHGAYDFKTLETVTRGYEDILKPIGDDMAGFTAYIVSKRALELHQRGVETGFDVPAAREVVAQGAARYEPVAAERLAFKDAMLKFLVDGEIVSQESAEAIREANQSYVPFYRFFAEGDAVSLRGDAGAGVRDPVRRIGGSTEAIRDPIVSDFKDIEVFLAMVNENAARRAFVKLGQDYAVKQPRTIEAIPLRKGEAGMTMQEGEEAATIFRARQTPLRNDEIAVYEKGERVVYRVDPKVAEAFEDLDRVSANILAKMVFHFPAKLLRAGVTLSPDYMMRNVMRDGLSAFIYAGSHPLKTLSGAFSLATKDEAFHKWMKGGGANATWVAIDREFIHQNYVDLQVQAGILEKAWNAATSPLEVLRTVSEFVENSTRLGAVKSQLDAAKTKAQIQALSFIAREATVDFSVHGKEMQEWSKATAFLNPWIQGTDRFARAVKDNPVGVTAKALAAVTLPALYLWWANKDDKEIQDLPTVEKVLFHHVRTSSGIVRVPMVPELGMLFAYLPTQLLDRYYRENPDALKHLDEAFAQLFASNIIPTAAVPLVEQISNKSLLSGRPIIPEAARKLLPEYQYTDATTELTKAIAQAIAAVPGVREVALQDTPMIGGIARALSTPVLLDNYLRAWTGGIGQHLRYLADAALRAQGILPDPPAPTETIADLPILKAFFVRHPGSSQAVEDFYKDSRIGKRYWDTAEFLAKAGDPRASAFLSEHLVNSTHLSEIEKALGEQASLIRLITKNPSIPPDEQRQSVEMLSHQMVELAIAGNAALKLMREAFQQVKESEAATAPAAAPPPPPAPPVVPAPTPPPVEPVQKPSGPSAFQMPLDGEIIRTFGDQKHPRFPTRITYHDVQIHATKDRAVHAALDGTVVFSENAKRLGPTIIVEHEGGKHSIYKSETLTLPQVGRHVKAGDVLGSIASGGDNVLSFSLHEGKDAVDPLRYLRPAAPPVVRQGKAPAPSLDSMFAARPRPQFAQGVTNGPHINE